MQWVVYLYPPEGSNVMGQGRKTEREGQARPGLRGKKRVVTRRVVLDVIVNEPRLQIPGT